MSKQDVQENENLATYWRRKLDWYTWEATKEEYDEEEVRAIRAILEMVESEGELDESYYNAEKSLERFRDTLDMRLRIQDEMRRLQAGEVRLADYPDDEEVAETEIEAVSEAAVTAKKIAERRLGFRNNRFRKVAMAASLVATLVIGGTVGAYAQREGFFGKVMGTDNKSLVVTSPTENFKQMSYDDIKDIPFKYLGCIWTPTGIPDTMEFSIIRIAEDSNAIKTYCEFINKNTKQFVATTKRNYKDTIVITDQLYDGFKLDRKKNYNSIEVEYWVKENKDYTEYIALFEIGNSTYCLSSNCDFDSIERIIQENISNNNL